MVTWPKVEKSALGGGRANGGEKNMRSILAALLMLMSMGVLSSSATAEQSQDIEPPESE